MHVGHLSVCMWGMSLYAYGMYGIPLSVYATHFSYKHIAEADTGGGGGGGGGGVQGVRTPPLEPLMNIISPHRAHINATTCIVPYAISSPHAYTPVCMQSNRSVNV